MAEILVTEAALRTLSVTIESLTVSGKQMTLAVFRQLPSAEIYAADGNLLPYRFWGVVRYSIKDEGDFWAVFESGEVLYRGRIKPGPSSGEILDGYKVRSAENYLAMIKGGGYSQPTVDAAQEKLHVLWRSHEAWVPWRDAMLRSKAKLLSLPQLFIAV